MSQLTSATVIKSLDAGLAELERVNKRIEVSKDLKSQQATTSIENLYKQYFDVKAEIIERYRKSLSELDKLLESNRNTRVHQNNQRDSIQTELLVEKKVGDDEHKIAKLTSDLETAEVILGQLNEDRKSLEDMKTKFLDAVEKHGFDRQTLTAPYDVVGTPSTLACPRCRSKETSYLDKSPNPRMKCSACGNVWKS